jgi:hypothetical protein
MSKRGSYIGGHTIVGPHTGWFSGVGKKRKAKKKKTKAKKALTKFARIEEEEARLEAFRRQRREESQVRLKKLPDASESAMSSARTRARMTDVEVVRKARTRSVLKRGKTPSKG